MEEVPLLLGPQQDAMEEVPLLLGPQQDGILSSLERQLLLQNDIYRRKSVRPTLKYMSGGSHNPFYGVSVISMASVLAPASIA